MEEAQKPAIFAIRTTIGQEKNTVDMVVTRARNFNLPIKTVLAPPGIRGYIFVEAVGKSSVERARVGIKHSKGMVAGEVPMDQIEQFLVPKPTISGMEAGDIVELVSGPFRGERARVMRLDEGKEEITVELFEATVPIPVTVRGDSVKVIQKKEKEETK
ncbi:MAG: transcription elongation factor Spt5 [Hadesarchaea archaeon]|nr:transcription elongation factor Spt5 [Hadesarchaea archaeon]